MKRISIALFALAALVTAGSAVAQEHAVKATVPFDFTVGNAHLPAGTYTISSTSTSPTIIEVKNDTGRVNIFGSAYADSKQSKTGKLVFDKQGDQYFLREILCSTANMNMELPVSKAEKRLQQLQASLPPQNENQVFVALNELR